MLATSQFRVVDVRPLVPVAETAQQKQITVNNIAKVKKAVPKRLLSQRPVSHVRHAQISPQRAPNVVTPNFAANLLGLLAGSFGLAWLASVIFPRMAMDIMFNLAPYCEAKTTFIGFVSYFPVVAACLKSLQSAVQNDRLGSDTYRTLNLALMLVSVGFISNCFTMGAWNLNGVAIQTAIHVVVFLIAASGYIQYSLYDVLKQMQNVVKGLLMPANFSSFMYGAVVVTSLCGFYALGINTQTYVFGGTFLSNALEVFMQRSIGISCLLYAMVAATLKDASNRGRLGASTFKTLNIGMILMALSSGLKFVWAYFEGATMNQRALISIEVSTGITCAFLFSQLFAKKQN